MFFHRNQNKSVKFVQWVFLDLIVLFVAISTIRPSAGLAGIGAVLVLGSLSVLANKEYIYENYKKAYKKPKSQLWHQITQPSIGYRNLNVYVIWPVIFLLGLASIYAAVYVD